VAGGTGKIGAVRGRYREDLEFARVLAWGRDCGFSWGWSSLQATLLARSAIAFVIH
jgi:hypothetical protein